MVLSAPDTIKYKKYDVIIDDLGAFCLSSWILHITSVRIKSQKR